MPDTHALYRPILTLDQQRQQSGDADDTLIATEVPASPSRSIGPLDEIDEDESYAQSRRTDDTPRQSLAGRDPRTPSAFYSQSPTDAASRHTFGTSSASSRSGSRSRTTSSTTHTSIDDLGGVTFNPIHHHPPLPPDVEFDSEEELSEEYDSIEVSSARGAGSMDNAAFEALLERQMYTDPLTGRRPSLPMAIPGVPQDDAYNRRDREGSLATLRRPSRSLDDQVSVLTLSDRDRDSSATTTSPPTPVSVPESDGDWRSLSARVAAREPPSPPPVATVPTFAGSNNGGFDAFGFDLDWSNMQGGITGLDMRDIAVHAGRSSVNSERRPSQLSLMLRRPSTASTGSIMLDPDTFAAAVRGWGGEEYERQRKYWTFRRDNADGRSGSKRSAPHSGGPLSPVRSITSGRVGKSSERGSGGDRPKTGPWRGMALNAEEIWNSALVGSFKVRRIELRPQKPQQRVTIDPFRGPYTIGPKPPHDGAYTNIHKHSKVMAFSIHRHYKPTREPPTDGQGRASTSGGRGSVSGASGAPGMRSPVAGGPTTGGAVYEERRRPTAMILLAPRHVQEAYTNTNTTKGLRSHGLLDEGRDRNREDAKRRERERGGSSRNGRQPSATRVSSRQQQQQQTASVGSVRSTTSTYRESPPPAAPPPTHAYPPPASIDSMDSSPTFARSQSSSRRRRRKDSLDMDDSDSETERMRSRTTHNEAFSTMDANSIDQMVLAQDARGDGSANGVLSRVLRRTPAHPPGGPSGTHQVYVPPWVTLQSRVKQEERRRRHDVLSNSFEDVGLLPPKKSSGTRSGLSKKSTLAAGGVDIFAQVAAESLFMLLPLWPGQTDPISERSATRAPHEIPTEQRQYLLVAYNPTDERPPPKKDHDRDRKNRSSHSSPTSSGDGTGSQGGGGRSQNGGRGCDILLTTFHISARLVSHQDLQGSGVRVPDEGLAVLGPWHEAWLSMPQIATRDHGLLVIGTCSARDAGIEFDPEGLVKMGLSIPVPPEPGMGEEPVAELTPIGRAVLEMAWIGCVAVTSFGPAGMNA
ncbi:hypothetical protein MKEN_00720300 [Mycena kentingensis (nom. inval.)]|nr:hypothetical protein MKEN_00720300 [Mycena kentingensis (nom. inval.)]